MSTTRSLRRCSSISTESTTNSLSIQELRNRIFLEKYCQKCSQSDLHRIKNEDWWLDAFLQSYDYDVDITFAVIAECIRWRNNFNVENISILALKPLLDSQLMYIHGHDVEGNSILFINFIHYKNGDSGFENLFVFWIERHYMETKGAQLTVLLDMTGTSLKNMDFNLLKFMFHAFKYYYPNMVQRMIVFESPLVLNASWKVVKSWLDSGYPQIYQTKRESISQFVDVKFLQLHQGGNDVFHFTMDELAKGITSDTIIRDHVSYNDVKTNKTNLDNFPIKRFVKFDDCDEEANRKTPLTLTRKSHAGHGKPSSIPLSIRPIAEKRIMAPEVEWIKNTFILVSPCDELILIHVDGEVDYIDIVAIRNISSSSVMFKIKTTSPEKFRVRPSAGIIAPGATEIIRVYLQSEYKHSCTREKFLLMALETSNRNTENFGELWKQTTNKSKVEHKLRCKIRYDSSTDNSSSGNQPEHRTSIFITQQGHINSLQKQITNMAKTQYLIIVVISLLFAMLIVTMLYERSNYQILRGSTDELASNIRVLQERTKQMTAERPTALPSFSPRNYDEDL